MWWLRLRAEEDRGQTTPTMRWLRLRADRFDGWIDQGGRLDQWRKASIEGKFDWRRRHDWKRFRDFAAMLMIDLEASRLEASIMINLEAYMMKRWRRRSVLFGRRVGCDVRLVSAECVDGGCAVYILLESQMPGEKKEMVGFKIHGPGLHLAVNACAAAAVALSLRVPLTQTGKSLSRFRPVHMRSQVEVLQNGITIINDTYNASLTSMIAAINSLTSIDCSGQRVAILGDMLELGEAEANAHKMVLELCCDTSLDAIMVAGERFLSAAKSLNFGGRTKIICAPDSVSLAAKVSEFVASADVVLVKGSRGMKMEKVVEAIKVTSSG